jgi:plasmid maintenance system antidote protein VapI
MIRGYKPQLWPKQKLIKKKYITERTTNRMTRNFGFSPPFWQQVPKTKREREKRTHESISSRRRIGRRI